MKIQFDLENCYGINKLNHEFDFFDKQIVVIHSPNGTMKTSLCKTIQDYIEGKSSQDLIDPSKITKRIILINGSAATKTQLQVFNNYNDQKLEDSIKKVMLSNALRKRYEVIITNEKAMNDSVVSKLAAAIGMQKATTDQLINSVFSETGTSLKLLGALESINRKKKLPVFPYKHNDLFNPQTKTFFENPDIKKAIENYTKQYEKLLKNSILFTSGIFDVSNLNKISASLKDNNYFEGRNKLLLNGHEEPIESFKQLDDLILEEISKIDKNPEVVSRFKSIINKNVTANQNVSKVFEFLKKDVQLAKGYKNYQELEKMYLLSELGKLTSELLDLKKEHKKNRASITTILKEAYKTQAVWEKIIPEFRKRFKAKFDIIIMNKVNHVLGFEEPQIEFYFETFKTDEKKLKEQVFSTGENRAYHLLQILFEIELIKEEGKQKIVIFDDIADSYDYTNKLVVLHYLEEISEISNIYMIVLTHNFDFYRSIGLRMAYEKNSFFANKSSSEITIQNGKYLRNVFEEFKSSIGVSTSGTIAIVPFARNLIEYSDASYGSDSNYQLYTKLIHYRPYATNIRLSSLVKGLSNQFNISSPSFSSNPTVYSAIETEALLIAGQTIINQTLEEKMVITIALRIKCEKYMYKKILKVDSSIKTRIRRLEMGKLLKEFKAKCSTNKHIGLISTVSLLAPPHIHVNNFMYEPMIDYSIEHFRQLYRETNAFLN